MDGDRGRGRGRPPPRRRVVLPMVLAGVLLAVALPQGGWPVLPASAATGPASAATGPGAGGSGPSPVGDPASLVNPVAGTGAGAVSPGTIGEFPGADLPFGMIQWSPDTSPHRAPGSGYSYRDSRISGFSLTHLSGTGCASYGDVPILPTVGGLAGDPASASVPFSHRSERATPGRYQVTAGRPGVTTRLAVTTRTGIAAFTFPATRRADVLLKVAGSANGSTGSTVRILDASTVSGQVTSGGFCGTGTHYTLYFVARFDRPFAAAGTWRRTAVQPGSTACTGAGCGAYLTFDARRARTVLMKVGISFVSAAGAAANLGAENPGWSLRAVASAGRARWNALLGRVRIGGGTASRQRTFYTALYHSLLHPNVVSDVDRRYAGSGGTVEQAAPIQGAQYANFSEWDVYRSEIELEALLAPSQTGAMIQSLLNDARQVGWLPKWAIVGGDAAQMNGDSADPIIAAAYAFGARRFDSAEALGFMVKGATRPEPLDGLKIERQYLSQYLAQHYVSGPSPDLDSIDYSIGGSVTLEYAMDDFAVAQMARANGDGALYESMMARAHNWQYLFNPATGYVQARNGDGSFPPGPAFNRALLEPGGELGFEEGNAVQYTWSVPQDLAALGSLMGGDAAATSALNRFFTKLNATRFQPYDWAGNEPDLGTAWEYDYFGAPWRTQAVVRRIADTLYSDAPVDEPGNDDLGALSSWYVWAAVGLYPVTPGTADLAMASPLFPIVRLTLPDGKLLVLRAPAASPGRPYVHRVLVTGLRPPGASEPCDDAPSVGGDRPAVGPRAWTQPWLPARVLSSGATLTYEMSSAPDRRWGAAPGDAPPSYGAGRIPAVGFSEPSGAVALVVGRPATVRLGVKAAEPGAPPVAWRATATGSVSVSPASGTLAASSRPAARPGAAGTGCPSPLPVEEPVTVSATAAGAGTVSVEMTTAAGQPLPPVVMRVDART